MLSKRELKLITSLQQKKYRDRHRLFIVEGVKAVKSFIQNDFEIYEIFGVAPIESLKQFNVREIPYDILKKISALHTPTNVLAVFKMKTPEVVTHYKGFILVLDGIRDPGNLGTIIRLCDWFGVAHLVCSQDTVDCYNPKVVQATMGSLGSVHISYSNLHSFLNAIELPIYGATMEGESVYEVTFQPNEGVFIMGNEANGISKEILNCVQHKITIPKLGANQNIDSLNVGTATAILLSEFFRDSKRIL